MDRTLISWNVPNLITIPLMAFAGFLLIAVIWNVASKGLGLGAPSTTQAAGY